MLPKAGVKAEASDFVVKRESSAKVFVQINSVHTNKALRAVWQAIVSPQ